MSADVVTFGESMALFMPASSRGIERGSLMEQSFGGAESNVAIGLARLGHRVGWFGKLGNDPLGNMILKSIRGEGVDVSRAKQSDDGPTGLMLRQELNGKTSVYYYRRFSAMSTMKPSELDAEYIASAKILHITGITPALSMECRETVLEAIRIARRNGVKVCFDPNLRLKLWSVAEARETLLPLAEQVDYFLPGLDELQLLYETQDFAVIAERLHALKAVSVVKGGNDETLLLENGAVTAVPYFKVERVIDTVGAGDGFCAGFISGLLQGLSHPEAVKRGNLLGSMVVQAVGDWEGLPTRQEVEAALENKQHIER